MLLPVVVAPGILEDKIGWESALDGLRSGFSVIENQGFSIEEMAQYMLSQAPDYFVLVGHSLGGYVALEAALVAPDRIAGLVLVSTTARGESEQGRLRRKALVEAAIHDFEGIVEKLARATLARAHRDALAMAVAPVMRRVGLTAFVREQNAAMTRPDQTGRLAAIKCPTLIISGDEDEVIDPAASVELAGLIANSTFLLIPGCGHMPQHEHAEGLKATLENWFQRVFA